MKVTNLSRRLLYLFLLAVIITATLTGCSGGTSSTTAGTSPSTTESTTPEPEPYLNIISTKTESALYTKEMDPWTSKQKEYEYTLSDANKIFLEVTFWIRSSSNNVTLEMQDIFVVDDKSGSSSPVGYRFVNHYWSSVFTSGNARMEFSKTSITMYDLVFEYKVQNTLGIFCETSFDRKFTADRERITGGTVSSITLAFVVSKSSVNSGSLWLYVPNSPFIFLTGPNTTKTPTITPSPQITTTTTTTTTTTPKTTTTTPKTTTTPSPTPTTTTAPTTTQVPVQSAGEKLLFVVYSETGLATLHIINTDGSDLSALVELENLHYSFGSYQWSSSYQYDWPAVSLSPDGKRVAYFSTDSYLCILDLNEGNTTKIKQDAMGDIIRTRYIAWSPDGNKIAYINYRGNLHIINVDGSGDWEVDTANVGNVQQGDYYLPESDQIRHPVWSSDGGHILYDDFNLPSEMAQYDLPMDTKYRDVYRASTDMLNRQITDLYTSARVCSSLSAHNRVLIRVFRTEDEDDLYIMNDDGTNSEVLPVTVSRIEFPKFSPDGNYILVGYLSPTLIDANTLKEINLPSTSLYIANFVWSPDSQYIACYSHWFGEDAKIFIVRRNLTSNLLVLDSSNLDEDMILIAWIIQQ